MRDMTESELCAAGDICFEQDHAEPHPCPTCRADIIRMIRAEDTLTPATPSTETPEHG